MTSRVATRLGFVQAEVLRLARDGKTAGEHFAGTVREYAGARLPDRTLTHERLCAEVRTLETTAAEQACIGLVERAREAFGEHYAWALISDIEENCQAFSDESERRCCCDAMRAFLTGVPGAYN